MKIEYSRLFSFGQYENMRIGFSDEVSREEASKKLLEFVDKTDDLFRIIKEYEAVCSRIYDTISRRDTEEANIKSMQESDRNSELKQEITASKKRVNELSELIPKLNKDKERLRKHILEYPI